MPIQQGKIQRPHRRRSAGAAFVAAALSISLVGVPQSGHADGITLKVFGGSSLDQLAPRQQPDEQKKIQQAIFDGFLKANPDVAAIEWDAQGPQADAIQRLMTARLANQEMDLIACPAFYTNGAYVRRKLVMPITDKIKPFQDRIDAAALGAFTISGEVYGVPISTLSTSTIFYNVDLFAKLGIPVPKTYDELKAAVPKFKEAGVIPLLHQGSNTPMWPMWYFETFSQASGDPIGKTQKNLDGTAKFTDAPDVEAFKLIKQWVDDGILSKDSLSVDQDGMRAAFAAGKSAMYYGGTWEIPSLQQSVKNFKWGVFPFPKMAGTPGAPGHGGGADNGICVSSSIAPEKLDAAIKFIEYLTRPEVATLYLAPEQPIAASIKGVPQVEDAYAVELRKDAFPSTIKFLDWIWPLRPAIKFLADQGFGWFEILAFTSLSDQYARKYMQLGNQAPMGVTTDTDILRRYALLSEAQSEYGIRLSSLYVNAIFTNPVAWPYERDVLVALARLLKGFGSPVLVLGGGPSEGIAGPHTAEDYRVFCRALSDIGKRTKDLGIETVYHPHLDTFIERRDQLDRMMDELDTGTAGLCIDPAHLAHTNSDPVDALRTYISAVRYMHLKDTRVDPGLKGYDRYAAFCELGAGVVDLAGLVDVLLDTQYDGLAIIELDASQKTAEQSTLESIAYVRGTLGLALTPAAPQQTAA